MNDGRIDGYGFADPVDPQPHELRAWAYDPSAIAVEALPADWDLLIAGDRLAPTLFDLAMDWRCPSRRFVLHCLHIYAAETLLPHARPGRRRMRLLRGFIARALQAGDETMRLWATNCRVLHEYPQVFSYADWMEGGLVRHPEALDPYRPRRPPPVHG